MESSLNSRKADEGARVLLTAAEVAKLLDVPQSWVREQSRHGRIPTVLLGRYRRYRLDAIEAWIEELEAGNGTALGESGAGRFAGATSLPERARSSRGSHARPRSGR